MNRHLTFQPYETAQGEDPRPRPSGRTPPTLPLVGTPVVASMPAHVGSTTSRKPALASTHVRAPVRVQTPPVRGGVLIHIE